MVEADTCTNLAKVIQVISKHQPVLNVQQITTEQLQAQLSGVGSLDKATGDQLSFLHDNAYLSALSETHARVVLVQPEYADRVPDGSIAVLVVSPYLAYASATHLFDPLSLCSIRDYPNTSDKQLTSESDSQTHIHPTAQIADTAILESGVRIGAYSVIANNVHIGKDTHIESHVHIGEHANIGASCVIYPHVFIAHRCQIGSQVRIHANASIGSEGFGFAPMQDTANEGWERIVQLGRVTIGNGVRIGSSSCIDRGAIEDTVIEDNVIIDNLVQVGHNVKIGAGTAIAGKAGIAGSAVIGKRCMIGGGVGIAGHLQIADDVVLTGMTLVTKSIKQSGVYSSGVASMPAMDWRRAMVKLRSLGKKNS